MLIKFTKMHGLGNDFVVIDAVTQNVRLTPAIVRRLADRKTGIGCDQLLVVEPPTQPDIVGAAMAKLWPVARRL